MTLRPRSALCGAALLAACASGPVPLAPGALPPPPPAPSTPPVLAPPAIPRGDADDAAIDAAAQDYIDLQVALSPEFATWLGIHTRDTELDDRSAAAFEQGTRREEKMLADLESRFAAPRASQAKRTDLAILEHTLRVDVRVRRERKPQETSPGVYLEPLGALFLMIAREYAPAAERANNVLARLEQIPGVVAAAKANLRSPPRVWTQVAIEDAKNSGSFMDEARSFLAKALPTDRARVDSVVAGAKKAYADYGVFLAKEVLPRSSGEFAAGRPFFDFLLRENYFMDEDADAVLALGKRIFDATDRQMSELARRIDPAAKGWPEVSARIKARHPTAKDLIPFYRREVARARAFLVARDAVPFPPDDDCEVIPTPAFLRNTTTAAYGIAPPFDKTAKGFFFVTPVDASLSPARQEQMLRENDDAEAVSTVVHETYPGHHLQFSFSRRYPSVIRKATGPSIFSEGWALYSEELLAELGYYDDAARLEQLRWTLVRAARILIDVGLHTQGMTFDQAVALLTDRVHLERELALSEVKRYTQNPTQPLAYLVGREAIFKIRERYKAREGSAYTLKRFHAEVLSHGTIAPGLLAREIFEP